MPVRTCQDWQERMPDEQEEGEVPNDEVMAALKGDQKEFEDQKRELEAMLADNDRNLDEA